MPDDDAPFIAEVDTAPPAAPTEPAEPAVLEEVPAPEGFQPGMHVGTTECTIAVGPTEDPNWVVLHIEHGAGSTVVIIDADTARTVGANILQIAGPAPKKLEVIERQLITERPRPGLPPGGRPRPGRG